MIKVLQHIKLLLSIAFLCVSFYSAQAQFTLTGPSGFGSLPDASDVVRCQDTDVVTDGFLEFRITNTSGGVQAGPIISMELAEGVEFIAGSEVILSSTGGAAGVTIGPNIGTATDPQFQLTGSFPNGSTVNIRIKRVGNCDGVAEGGLDDLISVPGDDDVVSSSYDFREAVLSIVADAAEGTTVGLQEMVMGMITNGGNGCIDTFQIEVVDAPGIRTDSIVVAGMTLDTASTSGQSRFYIFTTPVLQALGLGDCLDGGESFMFTRHTTTLSCEIDNDGYYIEYGCNNMICPTTRSTFSNQSWFLDFAVPRVRYESGAVVQATNLCDTAIIEHTFTNQGTGPALNLDYSAGFNASGLTLSGFTGGSRHLPVVGVCINGVDIPFDFGPDNASNPGLFADLDSLITNADGMGIGLEDLDGDGAFDDLAAGQSFTITLKHEPEPETACPASRSSGGYKAAINYTDQCEDAIAPVIETVLGTMSDFTEDGAGTVEGPTDINDGETFNVEICGTHRFTGTLVSCPTDELMLVADMPEGFTMNTTTITRGTTTIPGLTPGMQSNDTVTATVEFVNRAKFCFELNLTLDCALYNGDPFNFEFIYTCDADADCDATQERFSCPSYNPLVHCPMPCPQGGLTPVSTNAVRSTLGFANPFTCTEYADPSTLSEAQLRRAMPCDTVCVQIKSVQRGGASGPTWDNAYVSMEYDPVSAGAGDNLNYAGGTVAVYDAVNMTYDTCDLPMSLLFDNTINNTGGDDDLHEFGLDLSSCLASLPGGVLRAGDSMNINMKVVVEKVNALDDDVPIQLEDVRIRTYNLKDTMPFDGVADTLTCDRYSLELYLHEGRFGGGGGLTDRAPQGCDVYTGTKTMPFSGSEDWYPGEIRPNYKLDSVEIRFTTNDILDFSTVELRAEGNTDDGYTDGGTYISTFLGTPDVSEESDTEKRYVWYNDDPDNIWPLGDMNGRFNNEGGYSFNASYTPSCESRDGNLFMIYYAQQYGYSHDPSCYEYADNGTGGVTVTQSKPSTSIANLTGVVEPTTDTVCWTVEIQNGPPVGAGFVFLGFEDANAVADVIELRDVTADTLIPLSSYSNGDWAVVDSMFPGNTAKSYKITAILMECGLDSLKVVSGYECAAPPTDPTAYVCELDSVYLLVDPLESEVQITMAQEQGPFTLCDPINDTITITSAQRAYVDNPVLEVPLPAGFMEDDLMAQVEYPRNSGSFVNVPISFTNDTLSIDLTIHPDIGDAGIPGTDDLPAQNDREVDVRLTWVTDCDFISGSRYSPRILADRPCGDPARGNARSTRSDPIIIDGAEPTGAVNIEIDLVNDTIVGCGVQTIDITTEITLGFLSSDDSIYISLPLGMEYVENSYMCSLVAPADTACPELVDTRMVGDRQQLVLSFTDTINSFVGFDLDFTFDALPGGLCQDSSELTLDIIKSIDNVVCLTEPGGFCENVRANVGSGETMVHFRKTEMSIDSLMARCTGNSFELTGQVSIDSFDLMMEDTVVIEFFCVDAAGMATGGPVALDTIYGPQTAGSVHEIDMMFDAFCVAENGIMVSINNEDNCICASVSEIVVPTKCPLVEVSVLGDPEVSCGDSIRFEVSVTPDTTGMWTTTGLGTLTEVMGMDGSQTQYTPSMGETGEILLIFTAEVSDTLCMSNTDTVAIWLLPDTLAPVFANCPPDTFSVSMGLCSDSVALSWPIPFAQDDCCIDTSFQSSGPEFGFNAGVGVYDICYRAEDKSGNVDSCCFVIEVLDGGTDNPVLACQKDMVMDGDADCGYTTTEGELDPVLAQNNCGGIRLDYRLTPASGAMTMDTGSVPGMTVLPLGENELCYFISDSITMEVLDSCCFTVTIEDNTAPTIICPSDQIVATSSNGTGDCTGGSAELMVSFADNCGLESYSYRYDANPGTGIGGPFGLSGTSDDATFTIPLLLVEQSPYLYTYTVTDSAGNTASCTFTIEVIDNENPTIDCSTIDGEVMTDAGECSFTMPGAGFDPSYMDNCSDSTIMHDYALAPSRNTLAGASFPVGMTTVVWTVTDGAGLTATCEIEINVTDGQAPEFVNCPSDTITVGNDVDNCDGGANWSIPVATDNCGLDTIEQITGPAPGSVLPVGITDIVYVARDTSGNTDTCAFVIEVIDTQTPLLACPKDMTMSNDEGECSWTSPMDALNPVIARENCAGNLQHTITLADGTMMPMDTGFVMPTTFPVGDNEICYFLSDSSGTQTDSCCFVVTVVDTESPMIACPEDVTVDNDADVCTASLPIAVEPSDNCAVDTVLVSVQNPDGSRTDGDISMDYVFEKGRSEVTLTVSDTAGNSSTCMYQVVVEDAQLPTIECPTMGLEVMADAGECTFTMPGAGFDPTYMDNCPDSTITHDYVLAPNSNTLAGASFPVGSTVVTWMVTDCGGNTATCEITIEVTDEMAPSITNCPASGQIIQDTDDGSCEAVVNFSNITGIDNCNPLDSLTIEYMLSGGLTQSWTEGQASGLSFPLDTTTVSYRITDTSGNVSDTCEFDVIVVDNQAPDAICRDIEVFLDENGMATIVVDSIDGGSYDNCGIESLLPMGDLMYGCDDLGFNELTLVAIDSSGNTDSCVAVITVRDTIAPDFECPADMTVGGCSGTVPDLITGLTGTDNCDDVVFTQTPRPGVTFGPNADDTVGVKIIATDGSGNMSMCIVTLTIIDNEDPYFQNCPDSIMVCNDVDQCFAKVNWLAPVAFDNCDDSLDVVQTMGPIIGSEFPVGRTQIEYTATDDDGNTITCSFEVIVLDCQSPTAICKDIDVVVGGDCEVTILPGDVDAGSFDNCGLVEDSTQISMDGITFMDSIVLTQADLDPSQTTIWLRVVDSVGNASVCTADIEVFDVDDPMVVCQDDITIYTEPDVCYGIVPNVLPPFDTSDNCLEIPEINQVPQPGVVWGSKPGDSLEIFVEVIDTDGNRDTCSLFAVLVDTMRPHFINCPRPTINVKTLPDWCGAFVNFSLPVAEDNCDDLVIRKLDDTGLTTGDMFPVGATVLSWIAEDASGNLSDTCRIKIIVNDAEAPTIECPEDVTVGTDAGACEATVRGIGPVIEDQCPDNVLTTFSIVNTESGDQISAGFEDASGELFGCGENVVTYRTQDHPLVLITEVSQELESAVGGTNPVPGFITANTTSGDDYVEVTNFGPNAIELNCLVLYRTSVSGVDSIMVPYDQELASGGVATFHFGGGTNDDSNNFYVDSTATDLGSGDQSSYELRFEGGVVDAVATNGGSAADFSGNVASAAGTAGIIREFIWDTDSADDWYVAEGCREQSIGSYNPDYPAAVDNGSSPAVGLQSFTNEGSECSFTVTVEDTELPMCGMLELNSYAGSTGSITAGCNEFTVTVGDAFEIGRVIIPVLDITHPAMGELSASLESPSGTEVEVSLMVPDTLIDFNGELSSGDWILRISDEAVANDGSLDAWTLELYERQAYNRPDTIVDNDPGLCSAEVTFNAPELIDNCDVGNVIVSYTTMDDIDVPDGGEVEPGAPITEVFGVGTTDVLFTLFDKAGNSSTCGFSITVEDIEPPVVTCPDDITVDLEGGECDAIVNFLPETAEDNCSIDTIYSFPPSGSVFSVGTTEVILIVEDPAGNSDTCTFNVIVNENIPEDNSLTCVGLLNVSLDENCEACIGADELLMGDDYKCYEDYCIVITDSDGNVLPDTCIGLDQVGDTLSVSVTDCGGTGVSCWGYIYVEDKLVPEIECPEDITVACNEATDTTVTGSAQLRSCEQSITIVYSDDYEEYGFCDSIRAQITRTWTATDESGNVGSCVQVISVKGFDELDLAFPDDITYDNGIRCEDVANDASATDPVRTGVPTIRGNSIYDNRSYCEVNVGYWDEVLDDANCSNGYSILRNWIVEDECLPLEPGVNPIRHIQRIRVIDLTPPTIECNEDLTIAVDAHNCFTVFNPMDYAPEASDNCGDIASIELVGGFSSSVLPLGEHQFTYRVTDNCRNSSECTINVSVVDRTVPVVICETFRQVALLPDGLAKVEAESFDDGSYDNCNPVWFKARRMEQGECSQVNGDDSTRPGYQEWFDDYVKFCCDDINNDDLLVVLRVYDVDPGVGPVSPDAFEGHWNECMVRVDVQDKLPPVIVCPADVTISCSDDYELDNLSEYGDPFVTDACDVTWEERVIAPNDCGAGQRVIRRIFTATDEQGLTSQCIQNIYLVDPTPFTICDTESRLAPLSGNCANNTTGHTRRDGVEWPADVELSTCMGGLSPEDLKANPSVDNRDAMPTIVGGACAQIAMDYDDESFAIVDDACEKIIRTWTIIDWCQFDAVTRDPEDADRFLGYWQYIQIIKLKNTIGPAIENCEDLAICDDAAAGCDAQLDFTLEVSDDCTDSLEIEVTWRLDADNDGVYDISGEGARINRRVPLGVHRIQWRVEDGCDNFELCEQIITATDCKLPTPYCDNGIATVVMPSTGSIEVWARDLDEGSFDNCTEQEDLEFLIQKLDENGDPVGPKAGAITLTCEDIPNGVAQTIDVRVYVIDEAGNEDYCVTYILLQDTPDADNPEGVCDDEIEVPLVGGDIETETGRNASLHSVRMIDTEGKEVEMVSFTDMGGEYVFGMMDEGYSVLPYKNDDAANGLSTLDLIAIQRHILGVQRLDSPYKMVAADVDHNEQINVLDLLDLQEVILGLRDEFRNNLSWRYSEVDSAPTMSAPYSIVEEVSLAEKTASQLLDIDFTAIKIGDVNGDVNPVGLTTVRTIEKRGSGLELEVSPEEVKKDATQGTIRVPVRASNFKDLLGYQFSLEYSENWSYVEIESGALEIASDQVHESSRTSLVTNWYTAQAESFTSDEVLFTLVFVGEKTSEVKELSILDAHITAESYVSVSASNAEEVQIQGVELRVGDKTATEAVFVLHQNDPNPWKDQTVIRYELPEEMGVTIRVVNAEGVELHRAEQSGLVGMNEYTLRGSDLGNYSGVLYYRVETDDYNGTKKMIRVGR